jgi:hypothetical protein
MTAVLELPRPDGICTVCLADPEKWAGWGPLVIAHCGHSQTGAIYSRDDPSRGWETWRIGRLDFARAILRGAAGAARDALASRFQRPN